MSLVICSNLETDADIASRESSIYKPYNFRNALSSNIMLPKDCQVALQSCKFNLDGSITIGKNNRVFYQYFGPYLNNASFTDITTSNSVPVRVTFFDNQNESQSVTSKQLAAEITRATNSRLFHPNLVNQFTCSAVLNASNDFQGYKFQYDIKDTRITQVPPNFTDVNAYFARVNIKDSLKNYSYGAGTLSTTAYKQTPPIRDATAQITFKNVAPISLYNGTLKINISGCVNIGGGNASRTVFMCGLARSANGPGFSRAGSAPLIINPPNYIKTRNNTLCQKTLNRMVDYAIYQDQNGFLQVQHSPVLSTNNSRVGLDGPTARELPTKTFLEYWNAGNTGSDFIGAGPYDLDGNASNIDSVLFTVSGEQVKIELLEGVNTYTLVEYDATKDKEYNLKPVTQACWDMLPYLGIITEATSIHHSLEITEYTPASWWTGYNFLNNQNCGWQQRLAYDGNITPLIELEKRALNDYSINPNAVSPFTYSQVAAGNPRIFENRHPVLTLLQDDLYTPSVGANVDKLFGFPNITSLGTAGFWQSTHNTSLDEFAISVEIPKLLANRSIFVRLDNMTQESYNAKQGNRSGIIAHIPKFQGQAETRRIFHEPHTLVYLDLNNPEPIRINSFDISFVYSNEQYVDSMVGSSIVVLHFKSKQ